jgi:hypothetical protein
MKRLLTSIFVLFFLCGVAIAEEAKPMSPKEVSSGMAEVWCQKMEECAHDKSMKIEECRKILFKSFKDGFDNVPKEQKLEVSSQNYGQCVQSIKAGTCESLKVAQTLGGCEFISVLNRPH